MNCPRCGSNELCYTIFCNCDVDKSKEEHVWKCLDCGYKIIKETFSSIEVSNIDYSLKTIKHLKQLLNTDISKLTQDVLSEKEIKLITDLCEAAKTQIN